MTFMFVCVTLNISGKSNLETRIRLFGANAWAGWIRPSSSSSSSPSPRSVFVPWRKTGEEISEGKALTLVRSSTWPSDKNIQNVTRERSLAWMEIGPRSFKASRARVGSLRQRFSRTEKLDRRDVIFIKPSRCFKDEEDRFCSTGRNFLDYSELKRISDGKLSEYKRIINMIQWLQLKPPHLPSMPSCHEHGVANSRKNKNADSAESQFGQNAHKWITRISARKSFFPTMMARK